MDNMLGCFLVFGVDIVAARVLGARTSEQVVLSLSNCFTRLSGVIAELRDCDGVACAYAQLAKLKTSIDRTKHWDGECRKEDFVWTSAGMPYKAELVEAIMRSLNVAYVAVWSLLKAMERSGEEKAVQGLVLDLLPTALASRAELYGRVVVATLREEKRSARVVPGVKSDPRIDRVRRRTPDSFCSGEEGSTSSEEGAGDSGSDADVDVGPAADRLPDAEALDGREGQREGRLSARERQRLFSTPVCGAAALTVQAECNALLAAMRRVQALLEEHTFWAARDWRPPDVESEEECEDAPLAGGSGSRRISGRISGLASARILGLSPATIPIMEEEEEDEADEDEELASSAASSAASPLVVRSV
uniref:Uncharacterized protein n=1 Tax=Alexandrium catenella TaxID=2925 RepID=A0A7S1WHL2_ALECA